MQSSAFIVWTINPILINSGPFLTCFMVNYDNNKDLNLFLSFPDQATPLILTNNLRIILGSKPEKFKNIKARKKLSGWSGAMAPKRSTSCSKQLCQGNSCMKKMIKRIRCSPSHKPIAWPVFQGWQNCPWEINWCKI